MNNLTTTQCIDLINQGKSDQLDGDDWSYLLRNRPQFADVCDWDKLSGWNWVCLLHVSPQHAYLCDWNKLNDGDWYFLIHYQPQFENHPMFKLRLL